MIIRAELRRKQSEYEGEACVVDKVIELPAQRFKQFSRALLADYDFIAENKNVIQYALDRPAVLTVMQGAANVEELKRNLSYLDASAQERDYSVIATLTPKDTKGTCVYCKHCHPCPAGLDIGLINKYYDLSRLGDVLAKEHYLTLEKAASDCLQCGHCNSRCPFSVDQMARMEEIQAYFGK